MRRPPFNPSDAGASAAGSVPAGPQSPSELLRFADAEDRMQSRLPCGQTIAGDEGVGLAVMLAPLRMFDDDSDRSGVFKHLHADVAGMSARRILVTVLPAGANSLARRPRRIGKQGGRRTNQDVDMRWNLRRYSGDRLDFAQLSIQSMHLSISGNQPPHVDLL